MFLFMILLFPAVLGFYWVRTSETKIRTLIFTGFLIGVFVDIFMALFTYLHRIPEYNFISNMLYFSLKNYILPSVILYLVYFFIVKESLEFRIKSFFPLIASFFAVYMPYVAIVTDESLFSVFSLFFKPAIYLSYVIYLSFFIFKLYKFLINRKKLHTVFTILFLLVSMLLPAILETLYIMSALLIFTYIFSFFYVIGAILLFVKDLRKEEGFIY